MRRAAAALVLSTLPMLAAAQAVDEAALGRLARWLDATTAPGGYVGAVAWVVHDGRVVFERAAGHRDLARRERMKTDAIFRIQSMTKPMATAAVLTLVEEGRLGLDDPVARWLPVFAGLEVADANGRTRAPRRVLTLRHLLTHTAGFALDALADVEAASDLADYAARVARAPLASDPGERFVYDGVNTEVACRIAEVASGLPFDRLLKERVLAPLGLHDTGFEVPPAQRGRIAEVSTRAVDGTLRAAPLPNGTPLRRWPSGAGGLYSTAADVARFGRMLQAGGTLDGVRVLSRKTVELMMGNQLAGLPSPWIPGQPGVGFGLGGSVLVDPALGGRLGSAGQYGWTGAATTWFTVDRSERLVAVLLMQHLPGDGVGELPRPYAAFQNLVYQALR